MREKGNNPKFQQVSQPPRCHHSAARWNLQKCHTEFGFDCSIFSTHWAFHSKEIHGSFSCERHRSHTAVRVSCGFSRGLLPPTFGLGLKPPFNLNKWRWHQMRSHSAAKQSGGLQLWCGVGPYRDACGPRLTPLFRHWNDLPDTLQNLD